MSAHRWSAAAVEAACAPKPYSVERCEDADLWFGRSAAQPLTVTAGDRALLRGIVALRERFVADALTDAELEFETADVYGADQPDPSEGDDGREP